MPTSLRSSAPRTSTSATPSRRSSPGSAAHGHAADREAERLIALVNGIALQALFAPDLWTEQRQVDALEVGLAR